MKGLTEPFPTKRAPGFKATLYMIAVMALITAYPLLTGGLSAMNAASIVFGVVGIGVAILLFVIAQRLKEET